MKNNCPTNLSAAVFGIANVLTEKLSSEELDLLGAFFNTLGDMLAMNAIIKENTDKTT